MFFGISMRPQAWAITLTVIALAIYLPFLAADWLALKLPTALASTAQIVVSYLALPFFLCLLHDKHALDSSMGSVFFYLYKWAFLLTGIAALAYWGVTSGDFAAGVPVFGGLMTVVGLMVFYVSWRSDKRHEREAGPAADNLDAAPLDDKTEAILAAASARAGEPKPEPKPRPRSMLILE
ncbi:hypothetical protein [Yoonia sp. BS5-3]|uniref:Uncharacterized protein n=1 Tax=Yoonia phaeophyticola TaxID=3137369 RepID=A0ABZ2V5J2_9RHOB